MGRFNPRLLDVTTPEQAVRELGRIAVDSCGISAMAPKMRTRCIKLTQLKCHQANILKQEMLAVGGDAAVARGTVACSIVSTDCILIGTDKQLQRLCHKLAAQPFDLPALAEELSTLLTTATQPARKWRTSRREFDLERPLIMGILNLTPDSFSDGGCCTTPERAVEQALHHGSRRRRHHRYRRRKYPSRCRPRFWRLKNWPVSCRFIERLAGTLSCAISVDTWKSGVARQAMAAGAEIINDISGFTFDPQMAGVAAESAAGVVLMHTSGTPDKMQQDTVYSDLMTEMTDGLRCLRLMCPVSGSFRD